MQRFDSEAYKLVLDHSEDHRHHCFDEKAWEAMQKQALAGHPHEICGLLIGTVDDKGWQVHEARAVANLNTARADDRFELDPQAYQNIDRELRGSQFEIIGVYHSHPDCPAKPSPTDLAHAWDMLLYPIVSVSKDRVNDVACWALNDEATQFRRIHKHQ